jgi:hypothetical protein
MAEFIEALLALFGLGVLGAMAWAWLRQPDSTPPSGPDPYRAGVEAVTELTAAAWAAQHALHQAAERSRREE